VCIFHVPDLWSHRPSGMSCDQCRLLVPHFGPLVYGRRSARRRLRCARAQGALMSQVLPTASANGHEEQRDLTKKSKPPQTERKNR
jgi:hypothetical protein